MRFLKKLNLFCSAVGNGTRIDIYLGVNQKSANKYRAYAEVYGIDGQGNLVPNCWISSMVNVSSKHFCLENRKILNIFSSLF